ncbi:MAG: 50S ribosomal protein L29, partial [Elusimicrobiota bacterium]|nr:50S ribosomal protein L29 [Elusimicrobiota bacterium]
MKAKQKETIKSKSLAELKDMLAKAKKDQFDKLFKHSTTPLSNPLEIRVVRREIALVNTLINQ